MLAAKKRLSKNGPLGSTKVTGIDKGKGTEASWGIFAWPDLEICWTYSVCVKEGAAAGAAMGKPAEGGGRRRRRRHGDSLSEHRAKTPRRVPTASSVELVVRMDLQKATTRCICLVSDCAAHHGVTPGRVGM